MHVKLPAWVIPVQWEKWNYTFKECQRRFNFDRNRNKPLLLAVVWDFEVLKFCTINGIGQVTRKPLSGENIQGTFFVLIKTRWDCFCNLQKVLSDSLSFFSRWGFRGLWEVFLFGGVSFWQNLMKLLSLIKSLCIYKDYLLFQGIVDASNAEERTLRNWNLLTWACRHDWQAVRLPSIIKNIIF